MPPLLPFYYLCHINPEKIMEMLRRYYHPDHASASLSNHTSASLSNHASTGLSTSIGSSASASLSNIWITDGTGQAIQHLHYLPFGEDWVDQRNSSWNAPYTFSGKEKDVETGYGYFGARYYDSGLSIWLSVDPMSDKYPSMSPYNYCENNPVILVDPDGMEIVNSNGGPDDPFGTSYGSSSNASKTPLTLKEMYPVKAQKETRIPYTQEYSTSQSETTPNNHNTNQTSSQNSSQSNNAQRGGTPAFGFSVDITGALSCFGFTGEIGCLWDSQLNFSFFKSTGKSVLFEGSVGLNAFIIPKTDFKLKDFEGLGFNTTYNFQYNVSAAIFGDFSTGAMRDYYFKNYGGFKIGFGLGYGGSISTTTTKLISSPKLPKSTQLWPTFLMCP